MDIDELKARMTKFGPIDGQAPERHTWERHCYELRKHVAKDDPNKFLQWSTLAETMFVGACEISYGELGQLLIDEDYERWLDVIQEPEFGEPARLELLPSTSGNLIHQAYHVKRWQDATGLRMENLSRIIEFGGGYGAMALVARRLGFKGEYYIFDLPEYSLLQEFYLHNVGIENVALCPVNAPDVFEPPRYVDLLIACWSLSEVETDIRDDFLDSHSPYSYLFAYQPQWKDIDNIIYFGDFVMLDADYQWFNEDACRGSRYLFGVKQ